MTKEELIKKLTALWKQQEDIDIESVHAQADDLLIEYINDPDITEAFRDIPKWYA